MEPNQITDPRILSIFGQLDNSVQNLTRRLEAMQSRDLEKEFSYGAAYTPKSEEKTDVAVRTQTILAGTGSTPHIFFAGMNLREVMVNYIYRGTSADNIGLAFESDDNPEFKNYPPDKSFTLVMRPQQIVIQSYVPATGVNSFSHVFSFRLPTAKQFVRLYPVTGTLNSQVAWVTAPLSVTFFGQ